MGCRTQLTTTDGAGSNGVVIGEVVTRLDDDRFHLYTGSGSKTSRLIPSCPLATRNLAINETTLRICRKYLVSDALSFVDSAPWLQAMLHPHDLRYRCEQESNQTVGTCHSSVKFSNRSRDSHIIILKRHRRELVAIVRFA